MDAVLVLAAEWWWLAPAGAAAGAGMGTIGIAARRRRGPVPRRLELEAALHDVRQSQHALTRMRAQAKVARAELLRAQAERSAERGPHGGVLEARLRLQSAERAVKAAVADLRARRASVQAARATMPAGSAPMEAMPLARLRGEHDALTARWMAYETDPAKAIDYPAMTDATSPALRAFLHEQRAALELRPAAPDARMTAAEFAAYREAVRRAALAFDVAEHAARRAHGDATPEDRAGWSGIALGLLDTAQTAIVRSAEAWQQGDRRRRPGA